MDEIKSVSDIHYEPKIEAYYTDIKFSTKGIQTLNSAIRSLPQTQFALVSKNEIICIFSVNPETHVDFIRMGMDASLMDLKLVHSSLKEAIP